MRRLHGGALALAALIACAGCAESLGLGDIRIQDTLHFDESADGIDAIDIEAFNGAIRVTGDDSHTIGIVATRIVRSSDESRGEEYARRVTVDIRRDGDITFVKLPEPEVLDFSIDPGSVGVISKATALPKVDDLLNNSHRRLLEGQLRQSALEFAQQRDLLPTRGELIKQLNAVVSLLASESDARLRFE